MEKQYFITIQLAGISGILLTILISLLAFRFFVLPQGRANLSTTEAQTGLTPPYLRLEAQPVSGDNQVITIDVLANTGGQSIVGADLDIEYNPQILSYSVGKVTKSTYFHAIQEEISTEGQVRFSVFNTIESDAEPVRTNADQEVRIATVEFQIVDPTVNLAQVQILFAPDQTDESNLILYLPERTEFPQDILQNVDGTIITLRSQSQ